MKLTKSLSMACIVSLVATGCAAPGSPGSSEDQEMVARCGAMAAGGALLGALIGGKGAVAKGAFAGLAACAVVEIASRQTKSSSQVEKEFKQANRNQLPTNARVDAYSTLVSPNGAVHPGDAIKVQSTIRAVAGTREPISEIKEVLIAYAPNGEEFKRGEKRLNEVSGSGEFSNSFTLRLPQGAPQGIYRLQTQLLVNGKQMDRKESSVQLAQSGYTAVLVQNDK